MRKILILLFFCAMAVDAHAARRALLIGINDYSASRGRDRTNLYGAVNDAALLRKMLLLVYGFEEQNIVMLTDQQATRETILRSIEQHLVKPAVKGDVVLFYFAGHGSQVRNSFSDEPDRMDESIVPADSRTGVRDIRDKELRPLFNAILDRGAHLTVILDACHSGSGARGLSTGVNPRGIKPDMRDVADRARYGPRPEDRGALVLSATQDFDPAWEVRDQQKTFHGTFSWALLRAMRDSSADESARDTFLRARARMRAETPFQQPVMAGPDSARLAPLLGTHTGRRAGRSAVFVENVQSDGTVALLGGRAHGLTIGSELRDLTTQLRVTELIGIDRSRARVQSGGVLPGAMLEVVGEVAHAWSLLESPPAERPAYRLALRRQRDGEIAKDVLIGGDRYDILLRTAGPGPIPQRYTYVFVIDSSGHSTLLFPRSGSVENRLPVTLPGSNEIRLEPSIEVAPPYGIDTYVLLMTDEPLADPWMLELDGVRTRTPGSLLTPAGWSIERRIFESVPLLTARKR